MICPLNSNFIILEFQTKFLSIYFSFLFVYVMKSTGQNRIIRNRMFLTRLI
ncbi:hypothetical protein HOLDEFILI_01227 [Holdemania filiformis DSM 12042]|uniref:Uncharacterized protein n=1 Tax=Holdemania filiformis DSM 12042 TaxID=545696 RepID=B9Y5Z5_9FIRM|nr:hypothetical protein HOLDEFILI_01227 [Holdemania filiformis DSM 12042]